MESNKTRPVGRVGLISLLLIALLFGLRLSSCSAPKIILLAEEVEMPTKDLRQGRALFNEYCATCHPGGMGGLGLGIINKPLPGSLIRFQIRNGIGVMPAFNESMLTDEQVENISDYIVYLRKGKKGEVKED